MGFRLAGLSILLVDDDPDARDPGERQVPIIALTALVFPGERSRIEAAGFDVNIPKPYDVDELQTVIERLALR